MKKIFILSLLFIYPTYADLFTSDIIDGCRSDVLGFTDAVSINAVFEPKQFTCESGQYLPVASIGCEACPVDAICTPGTYSFNEKRSGGITYDSLLTQNKIKGCDETLIGFTDAVSINAVFEPKQFTCESGQYLPVASVSCEACPVEAICTPGTYSFNEKRSGGITYDSLLTQNKIKGCDETLIGFTDAVSINAVFEPKHIDCVPGYYLVGNSETCTQCPKNNKCVGGTYTFNETADQGMESCPEGTFAPIGSAYCYEHILHIGDDVVYLKSTKLTTPSLNIGMDDGVFYANMTTVPTRMNAGTEHYLKIEYAGVVYYVCDDTTYSE